MARRDVDPAVPKLRAPRESIRTALADVLDDLADEPVVWIRAAAVVEEGRWVARLLELTSGEAPPSWDRRRWEYRDAIFLATLDSGSRVADALRGGLAVPDETIGVSDLAESVAWERRQSGGQGQLEALEWPSVEATLSASQPMRAEPSGHLVSTSDAPSFVNHYAASSSFFFLDRQPTGGSLPQGVLYRHQDLRARLTAVRISAEQIEVDVDGSDLRDVVAELAGDSPGRTARLWDPRRTGTDTVTFPIEDQLPAGAWVLLHRSGEWLDRRFLAVPWTRGIEVGVETIVEPRTRLEAFLAERETDRAEFKRSVPTDDAGKAKVMKTVCAFANGSGGSILFGIDDDHRLTGVPVQAIDRLRDQLTQTVDTWVGPRPLIGFDQMPFGDDDRVVLELQVSPGSALHGCARPGETPVVYVRHLATTVRARPSEIEAIVRSRTPPSAGSPWR